VQQQRNQRQKNRTSTTRSNFSASSFHPAIMVALHCFKTHSSTPSGRFNRCSNSAATAHTRGFSESNLQHRLSNCTPQYIPGSACAKREGCAPRESASAAADGTCSPFAFRLDASSASIRAHCAKSFGSKWATSCSRPRASTTAPVLWRSVSSCKSSRRFDAVINLLKSPLCRANNRRLAHTRQFRGLRQKHRVNTEGMIHGCGYASKRT